MIDSQRLRNDLQELSRIGCLPTGGISRPAFSPADRQARIWFLNKLEEAGLETKVDEAGNISGRVPGHGPAVLCGSHLDTIENGGAYDGALGVLAALECARVIRERNLSCPSPLEVIAFSDEEESFLGFLGSLALVGRLTAQQLERATSHQGVLLGRAMAECDLDFDTILRAKRDPSAIKAFLELHIEQGPILEERGVSVGVVEAIKGNYRYRITLQGRRDHAGMPMANRQDPLFGAVDLIQRMRAYSAVACPDVLMTVGQFSVEPGLENVVPSSAGFSVDFRHADPGVLGGLEARLVEEIEQIRSKAGLVIRSEHLMRIDPVPMSSLVQTAVKQAADEMNIEWLPIQSGAGHDAQVLGQFVPTGMIFVPSREGRSHCPEEHTEWRDIERGTEVLLGAILRLALPACRAPNSERP